MNDGEKRIFPSRLSQRTLLASEVPGVERCGGRLFRWSVDVEVGGWKLAEQYDKCRRKC
jgi:hypothetical protein